MGCDIHCHVEIKVAGEWLHWNHPDVPRNYELFGKMAGVRCEGPPIAQPRGVPDDATPTTRWHYQLDGADAHTASWLCAGEMALLAAWCHEQWPPHKKAVDPWGWKYNVHGFEAWFGYLDGDTWRGCVECPDSRDEIEDARCVFWFDN